jgi:Methyltransferase domain
MSTRTGTSNHRHDDEPERTTKRPKRTDIAPPPKYGSQEYWETRYAKQFQALLASKQQPQPQPAPAVAADTNANNDNEDETLPYHSWYFTYDELRPLLLPILLGGREEARNLIEQYNGDDEDEDDDNDEEDEDKDGSNNNGVLYCSLISTDESPKESSDVKKETEDASDDQESIPIESDEEDDDDDEDEEIVERDGLARQGPVAVLEIGCGDVPLGAALALELKKLQDTTGASAHSIVTDIVCTDYSQVVVNMMNKQYGCSSQQSTTSNNNDDDNNNNNKNDEEAAVPVLNIGNVPLQFKVADARKLPFPDNSFALVLEKGTLDAMLSDTCSGVADCVKIVAECARVVSGCLVIISHLNAHNAYGLSWLEEVVVAGLRQHHTNVHWEIEVHGNSEVIDNEDERVPLGSSGPAVYIIHKKKLTETTTEADARDTPNIPVKFFSY